MKGRSKFYGKFQMVSPVQIELSLNINGYRKKFNMSQAEFATICNLCGEGSGVKFSNYDISNYELMKKAPRKARFQVLCNVLDMNPTAYLN